MTDIFNFRAWLIDYKMLVDVASLNWLGEIEAQLSEDDDFSKFSPNEYILMQCTGLKDKNGNLIFEGDILELKLPYRKEQTHYGDNIPMGYYTEPLEPAIETRIAKVVYCNGGIYYTTEEYTGQGTETMSNDGSVYLLPVDYLPITFTHKKALEGFSGGWGKKIEEYWQDDLEYLLEEYEFKKEKELLESLGTKIIGNIHENLELLEGAVKNEL